MTTAALKAPPKHTRPVPRENLCRTVPFEYVRTDDERGDGLMFTGYGAVFNQPTRIDSWEGTFDEQIAPGAFRKSLRERTPKFQFDHGRHPLIGNVPIGTITDIHEDERGLFVQARLGRHILIDLIREAIASGAIDGMSFRFSVVRDEWRDRNGMVVRPDEVEQILWRDPDGRGPLLRTLKEVKIAEVGPVVWPAYEGTSATVRSSDPIVIYPDRLHEPEQRKLLAEAVLRAEAAENTDESSPDDGGSSSDEPQDTTEQVAVEHSDQDTDEAPQPTSDDEAGEHATEAPQPTDDDESAGEHESGSESDGDPAPTDEIDAARAAETERLYTAALNEVMDALDANPPMKGL